MDTMEAILTRRSIRAYKPDAVPADVLARVLEAGTYAPSAMGAQSATIVAVETKAYRDRLAKLNAAVIGKDVDPYYGAPVIVLALADPAIGPWVEDASCALENMMLAAASLGVGSTWVMYFIPEAVREEFSLPPNLEPTAILLLGYPAPDAKPAPGHAASRPTEDMVAYNEF